jgi:hypothetical protein
MRRDYSLYGAGSTLSRQEGNKNTDMAHYWTCWNCGTLKEILTVVLPMSDSMKRPNAQDAVAISKEKELLAGIEKPKRKKRESASDVMTKLLIDKFKKSIKDELERGTSWDGIAKIITFVSEKSVKGYILKRVWENMQ